MPAHKSYPIQDSPFYKLKGKGQLERLLDIRVDQIPDLVSESGYRVWEDAGRTIQAPVGKLARVHARIAKLLKRITLPDYVYSRKGRSHIDNAAVHCGNGGLVKTDISKFYPSTSREMVLRLFVEDFACAVDIAHMLADLCCFGRKHLPTGSPVSGYVAFLAARPAFDRIEELATSRGCRMTAFVDDIAVSGQAADMKTLVEVRRELRRHGFKTKTGKSKVYGAAHPKKLTGAIITAQGLKLPNKQHQSIHITRGEMARARDLKTLTKLRERLRGQLAAAEQLRRHSEAAPEADRGIPAA